ncbi:Rhs family protein [mine drainage metagenome]|uniref:Rhs family protein n=1 Tax=mine drainage metagenome TaxID=410659 RepID=T1BQR7_9ZZZZ
MLQLNRYPYLLLLPRPSVTYLVSDPEGVRLTFDSSGTVTGEASYSAYGNVIAGGLLNITPFGYAGGYTDPTGLIYLVNRYYDPSTGQFLSVDPLVSLTDQPYAVCRE